MVGLFWMINWEENEGSYDEVMPLLQSLYSEGRENPKVPKQNIGLSDWNDSCDDDSML